MTYTSRILAATALLAFAAGATPASAKCLYFKNGECMAHQSSHGGGKNAPKKTGHGINLGGDYYKPKKPKVDLSGTNFDFKMGPKKCHPQAIACF